MNLGIRPPAFHYRKDYFLNKQMAFNPETGFLNDSMSDSLGQVNFNQLFIYNTIMTLKS